MADIMFNLPQVITVGLISFLAGWIVCFMIMDKEDDE